MKFNCLDLFDRFRDYFNLNNSKKMKDNDKNKINKRQIGTLGSLDCDEVWALVEKLIAWYTIKFPDSDLNIDEEKVSVVNHDFRVNNCEIMNINELFNRVSVEEKQALRCEYRSNFNRYFSKNDLIKISKNVNLESRIIIFLDGNNNFSFRGNNQKFCVIVADKMGKIQYSYGSVSLSELVRVKYKGMSLESLLDIMREANFNDIDYEPLVNCVNNRKNDIVTRKKIINYVALSLVYQASDYQYGYFRASQFLSDFDNYYSLNLCDDYLKKLIDKIKNHSINFSGDMDNNKKSNVKYKSLMKKKSTY